MKNLMPFSDLRSSLWVSLEMLVGLIISLCCVNQSYAQVYNESAWTQTNQLYIWDDNYMGLILWGKQDRLIRQILW